MKVEIVPYLLSTHVDPRERREQIFVEAWRVLDDGFYRPHFHLLDWEAVFSRYRDRLRGVHTDEDLNVLIRRMMGELNASHLGLKDSRDFPRLTTGWLGMDVETDPTALASPGFDSRAEAGGTVAAGAGADAGVAVVLDSLSSRSSPRTHLNVRDVLPGGPAARVGIEAGDRLLSVAGEAVGGSRPLESILRDHVGREVEIRWEQVRTSRGHITSNGEKSARVVPVATGRIRALERLRSVKQARGQLQNEVGSMFGYVRLDRIDRPHLDVLQRELRVQQAGREGLILDLRHNLGGDLPEEFLRALQIRPALWREPRGERRQPAPSPLWNKPLVVLIGPDTGSAAEIVAQGISELGLGVLVGEPSAGGVIGTREWELVDGRQLRIPHVGWATLEGDNLEGRGVKPDVWIGETFEQDRATRDATLHAAILVLQDEIAKAERSRSGRE